MMGEIASGIIACGISSTAKIRAEARVEPVSSKTKNERAKPAAMPPAAPIADARVTRVKSRVQSLGSGAGLLCPV